ncbi:hypothetical protein PO181_00230 [Leuconostoc suionicum]|uniref:hypothetical protein n=1 Tax=Leuconostoc suionicum TaxID=1511761 RepID=UPI00233F58AA|nr:hypothetical protein [Leuconostoc suionicum]MDC2815431.1 hypothetical protein [Leuconostoc suionicum]
MKKWHGEKRNKDMLFYGAMVTMWVSPFLFHGYGLMFGPSIAVLILFYSGQD